jgi:hypothetical protein
MDGRELRAAFAGEYRSYNQTQPAIDQQKVILGKPGRPRLRESLGLTSHITVRILVRLSQSLGSTSHNTVRILIRLRQSPVPTWPTTVKLLVRLGQQKSPNTVKR